MELADSPPLRSHLADFETTTATLLRPSEARALLNFAALFHEVIYLTDTAFGDHQLLISGFRDGHGSLFSHIARLVEEGILRALCRDKVVVRDTVLVPRDPTIRQIFEGWRYRDTVEWAGETGFTTLVDEQTRLAYYREVDDLLERCDAVHRYDPDVPKASFRERVREQLSGAQPTMLSQSLAALLRRSPEMTHLCSPKVDHPRSVPARSCGGGWGPALEAPRRAPLALRPKAGVQSAVVPIVVPGALARARAAGHF